MRVEIDREADALYFRLSDAEVSETLELSLDTYADVDSAGQVVGFEVINASRYEGFELPAAPVMAADAAEFTARRVTQKAA